MSDNFNDIKSLDAVTLDRVRALPDRWRRLRNQFEKQYELAAQGGNEFGQHVARNKMDGLDACLTDLEETLK